MDQKSQLRHLHLFLVMLRFCDTVQFPGFVSTILKFDLESGFLSVHKLVTRLHGGTIIENHGWLMVPGCSMVLPHCMVQTHRSTTWRSFGVHPTSTVQAWCPLLRGFQEFWDHHFISQLRQLLIVSKPYIQERPGVAMFCMKHHKKR